MNKVGGKPETTEKTARKEIKTRQERQCRIRQTSFAGFTQLHAN